MDLHIHGDVTIQVQPNPVSEEVLALLQQLGDKVSALSDTVDAVLASETAEDEAAAAALAAKDAVITDLQAQLAAANEALTASLANDAADAATIQAKQDEIDAAAADTQAQIDRLNAAFPPAAVAPPVNPDDLPHPDQTLPGDLPPQ